MNPTTLILTFAWLAGLGLSFAILRDHFWPILIAALVFALLVMKVLPKRG